MPVVVFILVTVLVERFVIHRSVPSKARNIGDETG